VEICKAPGVISRFERIDDHWFSFLVLLVVVLGFEQLNLKEIWVPDAHLQAKVIQNVDMDPWDHIDDAKF